MSDFDALLAKLPPMSRRQERQLEQEWRKQIKPKSVALIDQAKNFYMAVGQGISHWSRMETRLVQITAKLLDTSEEKTGLLMYSINFYAWLDIIGQLFELDGTYPRSFKKWRKLSETLRAENDIRVRLAHHSISQDQEIVEGVTGVQAYLRPPRLDVRKKSKVTRSSHSP